MPFTYQDARKMVGDSKDWKVGLKASILKWEQIASGDYESYPVSCNCGFCIMSCNRHILYFSCDTDCPAHKACMARHGSPIEVLQLLNDIDLEKWNAQQ